jgi:glycogen synthase
MTTTEKPTKQFKSVLLCESTWEVCNKIGGIYTVLASKAVHAQALFGRDNYLTIGPWTGQQPAVFQPTQTPQWLDPILEAMRKDGYTVYFGNWLIDGNPQTILIDWAPLLPKNAELKTQLWEYAGLDTLNTDFYDIDQPLLWSQAVAILVQRIATTRAESENSTEHIPKTIFHGHEWWMSGAILRLHQQAENGSVTVPTVFTTHATVLGRALSSRGVDIYATLLETDPVLAAKECNVTTKHQLEMLAARHATTFTTVSRITGREAAQYLGRTPTTYTENGLDLSLFPTYDELVLKRTQMREVLNQFIEAYFFPSYQFDVTNAQIQFTMGRYEHHNKGYDTHLAALGRLNTQLKHEVNPRTVVAFFFVPGGQHGVDPAAAQRMQLRQHLGRALAQSHTAQSHVQYHHLWQVGTKVCEDALSVVPPLLRERITNLVERYPGPAEVPISPFILQYPDDSIVQSAKAAGLLNRAEDPVKVVWIPSYLDGFDPLFGVPLYDLVSACDLGVFPSLYEPWGYTPMESIVHGVPCITSDLAGFGLAISHLPDYSTTMPGCTVIRRDATATEDSIANLATQLHQRLHQTNRDHNEARISAFQAMRHFDWKVLYPAYTKAYQHAIAV